MVPIPTLEKVFSRDLLDVLIRAGVIAVLVMFCFQTVSYTHLTLPTILLV